MSYKVGPWAFFMSWRIQTCRSLNWECSGEKKNGGCETELDLCHVFVLIVKHFLNFTLENENKTDRVY